MAASGGKRKPAVFLCGSPREHCTGSVATVNAGMRGTNAMRCHSSPEGAFQCHKNYLITVLHYTPCDDQRSLRPPDGGPVRVLTKPSRFGAKLRNGKEGTRNMPHVRGHRAGARGGVIVST